MTGQVQEFDFNVNLLQSLLWQYNNAANLESLLQSKKDWYDSNQTAFWQDWLTDVFDLRTANDFGCSVWAQILNAPIVIDLPPDVADKPVWGFGEYNTNFYNGTFGNANGSALHLTTEEKRIVLRLRYFQLISSGTVPETNRFLASIWGNRMAYLLDGHDMTQVYVFKFLPSNNLQFLFKNYDILPRPASVKSRVEFYGENYFGFGEYRLNFNNGTFAPE